MMQFTDFQTTMSDFDSQKLQAIQPAVSTLESAIWMIKTALVASH